VTVMLSRAPTLMVGTVKIVPSDHVELLEVSMTNCTALINQRGVGSKAMLDNCRTS
jgi:hypothetical protein